MIPEYVGICYFTEECGLGYLAKVIGGGGEVDQSEAWKLKTGIVDVDYTMCRIQLEDALH
jgi:hypothetical protein